jgi:hypothetical protein
MRNQTAGVFVIGASLAALLGAAALADGVVVASSSSAHAVGDRIEAGGALGLEDGAEVTVLDRSGAVTRIAGPGGRYDEPDSDAGDRRANSVLTAARLAVSVNALGRRSGLGAVRGGEEDCEVEPGSRSMPSPDCIAESVPIEFSVWSELDGAMACDYLADDGAWRRIPLAADGAPAAVEIERLYEFPTEPSDAWPTVAASMSVRCHAIDAAAWSRLAPYWRADLEADEALALMRSFADIAGGSFTEVAAEE